MWLLEHGPYARVRVLVVSCGMLTGTTRGLVGR